MLAELKPILGKILVILILVLLYYLITKYNSGGNSYASSNSKINNTLESFVNNIEKEKQDYLKLKETYIEPETTSLELLYTNYSGEEVNKDVWEDKTLDQCVDTCNKLEKCSGFSRDLVLDTEPSKCYPRTIIDKCYSNRKGNYKQMSNAIKYNSYIKSTIPNIINTCIGDTELTLNRNIHIKAYSMPNKYIGNIGDGRVSMVDITSSDFKQNCNFKVEKGKEGVGSVSFLHIDTNNYLYRDNKNMLIFKNINNDKTEDRKRVSFNIHDGLSNGIMLKAIPIEGETRNKYIMLKNQYLNITTINNNSINTKNKYTQNATFYIIDTIINTQIIDNKSKMINKKVDNKIMNTLTKESTIQPTPSSNQMMPSPPSNQMMPSPSSNQMMSSPPSNQMMSSPPSNQMMSSPSSNQMMPSMTRSINNKQNTISKKNNKKIINSNIINENFENNLKSSDEFNIYKNLFKSNSNKELKLQDYLEDNYLTSNKKNSIFIKINNKINEASLTKSLLNSIDKNEKEFNSINELNKEIEKEINNKNIDINVKNDKIINNIDNMRITDLSNDYFFLKNLSLKT